MASQTLEARVVAMEKRVTKLERLPARVDALTLQISQLRTEMRGAQMRTLHDEAVAKIDGQGIQMRVLHEGVSGRIALLSEGLTERGPKGHKRKR